MPFNTVGLRPHETDYHIGTAEKGAASGLAPLDAGAELPTVNLKEHGVSKHDATVLVTHDDSMHINSGANIASQGSVIGSRAVDTIYQNTTGKPMFVSVSGVVAGEGDAVTDTNATPTTIVSRLGSQANQQELTFIVLAGSYYKVQQTSGTFTLNKWTEWY